MLKTNVNVLPFTVALAVVLTAASSKGDILGFSDLSGFTINRADTQSPPVFSPQTGALQMTSRGNSQSRSVFFNTPQSVNTFDLSFVYQTTDITNLFQHSFGTAVVLQNSPDGVNAMGSSAGGNGYGGIADSVAISLELNGSRSGLFTNGDVGGGAVETTPVDLRAGNPIAVTLSYDGARLRQTLLDTRTNESYEAIHFVDIVEAVGSETAYVGLTASTPAIGFGDQFVSDLTFVVPEPSSLLLAVCAMLFFTHLSSRQRTSTAVHRA